MRRLLQGAQLALPLGLLLAGCGGGDAARNEALLFLDRVETLDVDDVAERSRRVDVLENMALEDERVRQVRDACVRMHRALVTAEELTSQAYGDLGTIEGNEGADDIESLQARVKVHEAIVRSTEAIAEVRAARAPCQDGVAQLRARYSARR